MNSNFNLVQKPKKDEDEEYEEEVEDIELDDDDDDSSDSKSFSSNKSRKNLYVLMAAILGGTAILLLVLYIMSLGNGSYSYEEVEVVLSNAAESYFKDYPDSLPQSDGDIVEIDSSNLVVAGKMKDLSEYVGDGVACTGTVQVTKAGNDYLYTPFLNCGDSYLTINFADKIKSDNEVVSSGNGLYSTNSNYVFRGENINNYVQLDNSLWRIVKITSNNNVVLINDKGIDNYQPWDDRYNEESLYESGINTFNVSRVKDYLDKVYTNPDEDLDEEILSSKDKARMTTYNLCVGKRSSSSESKNNSEECKQTVKNVRLGLLTLSDYMYASLDGNCKNSTTRSCMNYNYLAMNEEWWLSTASSEDTYSVFKIDRNGVIKKETAGAYSKVRPVIYLNSNVMYKEGKGTEAEPYIVK